MIERTFLCYLPHWMRSQQVGVVVALVKSRRREPERVTAKRSGTPSSQGPAIQHTHSTQSNKILNRNVFLQVELLCMSVANRDRHHQVVGAMPSSWWCLSLCWTFFFLDHQPNRQDMKFFKKKKRKGRANENVAVKSKWLSVNVKNNNKEKYYIFF